MLDVKIGGEQSVYYQALGKILGLFDLFLY